MRLSAPIYKLKRDAKSLARSASIPLHQALDRVAASEGFQSWSHLSSTLRHARPAARVLDASRPGEMLLLAARPGHGKTRLGLEMATLATGDGGGAFFTLDFTERDVAFHLETLGLAGAEGLVIDTSDEICADYIIDRLDYAPGASLAVVDYLQLLDQRRTTPDLAAQLRRLKRHAARTGTRFAMIAQIDRAFDLSGRAMPTLSDLRLPNPVDLSLFDWACFLHEGEIQMARAA